jgi:hypothetical protein
MSLARTRRLAALGAFAVAASFAPALSAQGIPQKLSDSVFWKLVTDFSESGGFFQSDNFVSNETTSQWVIPELQRGTKPGGVYLGVGPDQNFPYILALKPKVAFIFDIRRQNVLTHLMYKALIEQSNDRADFLARLFARPRPAGLDTATSADAILLAYQGVRPDTATMRSELASIVERLTRTHGFTLSVEDTAALGYVYRSFVTFGPDITYNSNQRMRAYGRGVMPSYAQIQLLADSSGMKRGYLASESTFRALREYENNNLIVPVVGDFAGPKAIRAVGAYLKDNHATVTAFYLSNVEQYLFNQSDDWRRFFNNVAALPLDSTSTFIRSSFMGGPRLAQSYSSFMRSQQLLASMMEQLRLFTEGKIQYYGDVISSSR